MNDLHPIARFVQKYFHQYLAAERGLSPNTILSYRDCLKLLFRFAAQRIGKAADNLVIEDFDEKVVRAFLDDLESTRTNSVDTRNNRLATLRSFFRYVTDQEPALMARCQRIRAISKKRTEHNAIEYLEDEEVRAVLESVDQKARRGPRDYALLLFLYNTGARVQEAVDVKISDIRLEAPHQVKLTGKGRKERVLPLWPETVAAIQNYLNHRELDPCTIPQLFLNANGQPITRFGIRYLVRRYAAKAAESCLSMQEKKISPHTLRHTCGVHLLQSGNDMTVVKDWLGHADINTTHGYVEIDMKRKRRVLEACEPPDGKRPAKRRPKWLKPGVLEWLEGLSKEARIMCSVAQRPGATSG